MKLQYILWDWNGTLLDDVKIALDTNNEVFPRFGLKPLGTLEDYVKIFDFPIRDYYKKAGVPDEMFDDVANAWAGLFLENSKKALLQKGAEETLGFFKEMGLRQAILSASKQSHLHEQVARYPIGHYFEAMLGLTDIYATSKVGIARDYLQKEKIDPNQALFIGDTLHDVEVAKAIGVRCVLVAKGHHSHERLMTAGVPVFNDLVQVRNIVIG